MSKFSTPKSISAIIPSYISKDKHLHLRNEEEALKSLEILLKSITDPGLSSLVLSYISEKDVIADITIVGPGLIYHNVDSQEKMLIGSLDLLDKILLKNNDYLFLLKYRFKSYLLAVEKIRDFLQPLPGSTGNGYFIDRATLSTLDFETINALSIGIASKAIRVIDGDYVIRGNTQARDKFLDMISMMNDSFSINWSAFDCNMTVVEFHGCLVQYINKKNSTGGEQSSSQKPAPKQPGLFSMFGF